MALGQVFLRVLQFCPVYITLHVLTGRTNGRSLGTFRKASTLLHIREYWIEKQCDCSLCREIIAVCSEMHSENINAPSGQNVEFFNLVVLQVTTGLRTARQLPAQAVLSSPRIIR